MANEHESQTSDAAGLKAAESPAKCPVRVADLFSTNRPPYRPSPITVCGDTAEITLRNGGIAIVDATDVPLVIGACWRKHVSGTGGGYVSTKLRGGTGKATTIYLHRIIVQGATAVDHIDGDGLNNRRGNLRPCTSGQNSHNRGPAKGRQFKGVFPSRARWIAAIRLNGVRHKSRSFATEEEAAAEYDRMSLELHGAFGRTNAA